MAYITREFYDKLFGETDLTERDFTILLDVSSEMIYAICCPKPTEEDIVNDKFMKAVAYQIRYLYDQGGVDAVLGQSDVSISGGSEHLGDYSISSGTGTSNGKTTLLNGIPVCGFAEMLLAQLGLMTRLVRVAWRAGRY